MKVAVFCSSSSDLHPDYEAVAKELGQFLGERRHTLVWGGCNVGLMNTLGLATKTAGGRTIAVVPHFMAERGLVFEDSDEMYMTYDMMERKSIFRDQAEAFVALPGGVGTWEELFEVITLKKLRQLDAPIVVVNTRNYYAPLLEMFKQSIEERFSAPDTLKLFSVANSCDEVKQLIAVGTTTEGLDLGPVG